MMASTAGTDVVMVSWLIGSIEAEETIGSVSSIEAEETIGVVLSYRSGGDDGGSIEVEKTIEWRCVALNFACRGACAVVEARAVFG